MKTILIAKNDNRREMPNCYTSFDMDYDEVDVIDGDGEIRVSEKFEELKQIIFEP